MLLNDGSRKLSVGEGFDKAQKTGFIVEYDDSKKHTVIYDANGGENAPIEKIAKKGETVVVTQAVPTKNNKTFMGWAYSAKAKKADVEAGGKIRLVKDTTLYAVWG